MDARGSASPSALLLVSLVIFIRYLVSRDNIRRNEDNKAMHWVYQYPLWKLAISITALCRTQMIWTNLTSMPSMLSEVAVFVVSVIFVVLELSPEFVAETKRTKCLLIRYTVLATTKAVTCLLWLGMFHFVLKSSLTWISVPIQRQNVILSPTVIIFDKSTLESLSMHNDQTFNDFAREMINEMEYLFLFKALSCVYSVPVLMVHLVYGPFGLK